MTTDRPMGLGVVGLGRMGSNIARRLIRDGHRCVVSDLDPAAVERLASEGAVGSASLEALAAALDPPRIVWLMVPAGEATDNAARAAADHLQPGDIVIDGGNTHYRTTSDGRANCGSEGSGTSTAAPAGACSGWSGVSA